VGFRFRWSDLGWGPLIWFAALLSQVLVAAVVLAAGVPTSSNTDGVGELSADRSYVIALAVTAVVAAPLVEELVFRGVVLRSLLSWAAPIPAIVLQGVLFGVAHVDPVRGSGNVGLAAILSGVGIALGAGAYLLRRIGPTVVAHAIFNGVVLAIILSGVTDRFEIG
jgi:membrane protease YdiL (CAAX protease family)